MALFPINCSFDCVHSQFQPGSYLNVLHTCQLIKRNHCVIPKIIGYFWRNWSGTNALKGFIPKLQSHSKPQFVIPNWRCERISESYINFIGEMGTYRFSLFITPSVREILFAIFWTCEFQFIYSFTVRPRKLNSVTRSIRVLFIMRHGISFSVRTRWR